MQSLYKPGCVFCEIVRGIEPAELVDQWAHAIAIKPLNPVVPGHLLVLPKEHVKDALEDPSLTGEVMMCASRLASGECNLITSVGKSATQTVFHLHVHIVPRREGDGLALPWIGQEKKSAN